MAFDPWLDTDETQPELEAPLDSTADTELDNPQDDDGLSLANVSGGVADAFTWLVGNAFELAVGALAGIFVIGPQLKKRGIDSIAGYKLP